jgi:predicted metalloprotease with PDZ domain
LSIVVLFSGLAASARSEEPAWAARYRVRFISSAAGVPRADVEATLRWIGERSRAPSWVDVGMAEDGFPKGYGAFVRDFAARVPAGTPTPRTVHHAETLSVPHGRYRLPVLPGGVVGFAYAVVLEHDPAGWGPGPDEAPYRFEEGAVWTGRAVFVTTPRSRVEVTFAPEGERVLTSFEPVAGRPNTFHVPDEERLRDSFLVAGRPVTAHLRVGAATVTLALGGPLKGSLPLLSKTIARFLAASEALFGGAPPRRILAVGNLGGVAGTFNGGTYGSDVSFLVDQPLEASNAGRWRPFLSHELFHLWNGYALAYEGQQYWMSEGFTDYYARLLLVRQGLLSGDDFLDDLRQRMARYVWRGADIGLQEAGDAKFDNTTLVYEGGSLAALCLDLQFRAATANRKSLDDLMKTLYAEFGGGRRPKVTIPDVIRLASRVTGESIADFFARHVSGPETLPLTESLGLAAIRVLPMIRLPKGKWVAMSGIEVQAAEGEPLRAGDVITEVGGSTVKTFDDLRVALASVTPGAIVSAVVIRDGQRIPLEVPLGGDSSTAPSRIRSVSAEVGSTLDPLALAIRKAIFGSQLAEKGRASSANWPQDLLAPRRTANAGPAPSRSRRRGRVLAVRISGRLRSRCAPGSGAGSCPIVGSALAGSGADKPSG